MPFDPRAYGDAVAQILALDADGERLIPLTCPGNDSADARRLLKLKTAADFSNAAHPKATLAGLWTYHSCFDEAHQVAQDDPSAEGSYWHAILHRQEPDESNSGYWFRRVGKHPLFPALAATAAELRGACTGNPGFNPPSSWDPYAFVDFCERARSQPGTAANRLALEIQRAEWQLLFDYCARKQSS